jgi:cellulose synthase/poly-beta-1,6-N-acetylglucosamine synthase-like glycosyltransferase
MNLPLIYVFVVATFTLVYTIALVGFIQGLRNLRHNKKADFIDWPSVSVIVPARNEAEVLERTLESLFEQDYPGAWEIVVVDDRSTDSTPQILNGLVQKSERLHVVTVTERNPRSPKKNALAMGIQKASGEIIVTTDADCVYNPQWLQKMISYMQPDVGVVAGSTVFDLPVEKIPLWQRIQWLDFFIQTFMGAGAIGKGIPSSCNGSNLAYRRRVFDEISGFGSLSRVVSGDDVLFAQRVAKFTKWKTVFATDPETTVSSLSVHTVKELVQQRLRWASKGLAYRGSMLTFLFGIYIFYMMLLAAPVVAFSATWTAPILAGLFIWKFSWDYSLALLGTKIFNQQQQRRYFIPYYFAQAVTYPFIGLGGLLMPYRWKGDWYRTAKLPRSVSRTIVRFRRIVRLRRAQRTVA